MGAMVTDAIRKSRAYELLAVLLVLSSAGYAGQVNAASSVDLYLYTDVVVSDNISLTTDSRDKAVRSVISPAVSFAYQGPRVDTYLRYQLSSYQYSKSDLSDQTTHFLDNHLSWMVLPERLLLETQISVDQIAVDPSAALALGDWSDEGNQADALRYTVRPTWKERIGSIFQTEAEFWHEKDLYEDDLRPETERNGGKVTFSTQNRGKPWGAGVRTEYDMALVDGQEGSEFLTTLLFASYQITRHISLSINGGEEKSRIQAADSEPWTTDNPWNVGVSWVPTTRTSLSLTAGQRSFGDTYGLDLRYAYHDSVWKLLYSEELDAVNYWGVDFGGNDLDTPFGDLLFRVFDDVFVQKTWLLESQINGQRNKIEIGLEAQERSYQSGAGKETSYSLEFLWNYFLSHRSTFELSIQNKRLGNSFEDPGDELFHMMLKLRRTIGRHSTCYIGAGHRYRDGNGEISVLEYNENQLLAGINLRY